MVIYRTILGLIVQVNKGARRSQVCILEGLLYVKSLCDKIYVGYVDFLLETPSFFLSTMVTLESQSRAEYEEICISHK
jgi:hypothetical protein